MLELKDWELFDILSSLCKLQSVGVHVEHQGPAHTKARPN